MSQYTVCAPVARTCCGNTPLDDEMMTPGRPNCCRNCGCPKSIHVVVWLGSPQVPAQTGSAGAAAEAWPGTQAQAAARAATATSVRIRWSGVPEVAGGRREIYGGFNRGKGRVAPRPAPSG